MEKNMLVDTKNMIPVTRLQRELTRQIRRWYPAILHYLL